VRIVSWNIRAGGGKRIEGIARQLRRWRPDVVALSEFRGTPPSQELALLLRNQGFIHQRMTVDNERPATNALLVASRWPLRLARLRGQQPEAVRWLAVRARAPQPFTLGAMHVPNRVSGRKYPFLDAVLALAQRWQHGPAIFLGDTNSGRRGLDEESPAFNKREEQWVDAMAACGWPDAFRLRHPRKRAYTWYSPNAGNGFRLDQAFPNEKLLPRLRQVRYLWGTLAGSDRREVLSDHAALIVDIGD
jgi:exonuclease III